MQYKRSDKVAAFIHEEVSNMLLSELKDPAIGFVTITKVRVTDDLQYAKIFYSVLGSEEKKEASTAALQRATGFFRSELGHRLKTRSVPTISFIYDDSTEYADHIEHLLKKIKQGD